MLRDHPQAAAPEAETRATLAIAAAWCVAGFAACWSVAGLEPNLVEEGLLLHVAQRLAAGEHLYRDIVFFTSPLPFELLGLLFRLFGEEIAVGRAAMAVFHVAATGAMFAFARRSGAGPLAFAAAACVAVAPLLLFPFFSMFYYTPLAFCLGALAVEAASRGTRSAGWACAAGVLVAAVALCKQTLGGVLAISLLPALALAVPPGQRLARGGAMALGGAAVVLLTLAWYGARGDLADLWRCLVSMPLALSDNYRAPFINLWPAGQLAQEILPSKAVYFSNLYFLRYGLFDPLGFRIVLATQLLYALPAAALALTLLLRLAGPLPTGVWLNAAFLLAMATNLVPRSDWGHLVLAVPPAFVQLLLLGGLFRGAARRWRAAAAGASALLVALLAASGVATALWLHEESAGTSWGPRVPLRPVSAVYRTISVPRVISFLRARVEPGEPIFVARAEPLLYFATDTTNPTPYTGVLTVLNDEQEERILAALPDVRYVVMSDTDQPLWTYYSDELPRVQKHLERYYRLPKFFPLDDHSWIIVLERGEDRGPTLIDLVDERPRARTWLRDRSGVQSPDTEPPPKLVARHNRRPLPVRLGPRGGGIDYEIEVPPNARFQAGVGYRGMVSLDNLHEHPKRSRMVVSLGRDGRFEVLHSERVSDARRAGRGWTPLDLDLSAYAGEHVTLRLELVPEVPLGRSRLTWWGSPRIAGPAPGGAGPTTREE
ncbi:MAG: hypothetical protein JRS35_19715 [Deltaproteobacteria bacterium]|nr:hypothetical protein [Deltaproteobacteria bacterium]